jgi:hypothetical protein
MSIVRIKLGFLSTFSSFQGILIFESCESFLLVEMHYYWTFSKKAHEFEFQPRKGQPTSFVNFDFTLVIVNNLHHVNSPMAEKKTYEKNLTTKN